MWEEHLTKVNETEYNALCNTDFPIIFNCYETFTSDTLTPKMEELATHIKNVEAIAVKFNLGTCNKPLSHQLDLVTTWSNLLPSHIQLLCECHAGTPLEDLKNAKKAFSQLPASRFHIIVHSNDSLHLLDNKIKAYGDRISHVHLQTCTESGSRTTLNHNAQANQIALKRLLALPNLASMSVEFTQDEDTLEATYQNAVSDLKFVKSYLGEKGIDIS